MKEVQEILTQFNAPTIIIAAIVGILLILQIIGEIVEFKGKMVPEFMKIRKYFIRKRKEHEALCRVTDMMSTLQEMPNTLKNVQKLLDNVDCHYNNDNISMRNDWIQSVNRKLEENDKFNKEISQKLDKNNADTLSLLIESKRNAILNFSDRVVDPRSPVTREQFRRIYKIHKEYEDIIKANNQTNGEVDIAFRIINEAYEEHLRSHSFIEDIRGYN